MSKKTTKKSSSAVLLIGRKPAMNYVLYAINQMQDAKKITIKARGKSIPRAVDVVEILRRRFLKSLKIKNVELGTAEVENEENGTKRLRRISTIEITFSK